MDLIRDRPPTGERPESLALPMNEKTTTEKRKGLESPSIKGGAKNCKSPGNEGVINKERRNKTRIRIYTRPRSSDHALADIREPEKVVRKLVLLRGPNITNTNKRIFKAHKTHGPNWVTKMIEDEWRTVTSHHYVAKTCQKPTLKQTGKGGSSKRRGYGRGSSWRKTEIGSNPKRQEHLLRTRVNVERNQKIHGRRGATRFTGN